MLQFRIPRYPILLLLLLAVALPICGLAQPVALAFQEFPVTFSKVADMEARTEEGNTIVYVVEKDGRIYRLNTTTSDTVRFLDLSDRVDNRAAGGLFSIAFHPKADSNYFYVSYTAPTGSGGSDVLGIASRFTVADGIADPDSEVILLREALHDGNHPVCKLAFGPDNYLYIPIGDGIRNDDQFGVAQNPRRLLGKLLRIDVDRREGDKPYAIPPDNPFVNTSGTRAEIWSLGLRHPWKISFDRQTGDLWIAEKGHDFLEEIMWQPAGKGGGENYGWNCRVGIHPFSTTVR